MLMWDQCVRCAVGVCTFARSFSLTISSRIVDSSLHVHRARAPPGERLKHPRTVLLSHLLLSVSLASQRVLHHSSRSTRANTLSDISRPPLSRTASKRRSSTSDYVQFLFFQTLLQIRHDRQQAENAFDEWTGKNKER